MLKRQGGKWVCMAKGITRSSSSQGSEVMTLYDITSGFSLEEEVLVAEQLPFPYAVKVPL